MYLIMKCQELSDQYECDADREPIALTEDWETYYQQHCNELNNFEVYFWNGNNFSLIKEYTKPMEYGMGLWYWTKKEWEEDNEYNMFMSPPHIVKKWPGAYNRDSIPYEICELIYNNPTYDYTGQEEEADDCLKGCGYITWYDKNGNYYVYGEYCDNDYTRGY